MRFRIEPRDVPADKAARRLGLSLAEFSAMLPNLSARGFPASDPDTGHFDLIAIDRWADSRNPRLFGISSNGPEQKARDASTVAQERIARARAVGG
jgi:hypothetical protein